MKSVKNIPGTYVSYDDYDQLLIKFTNNRLFLIVTKIYIRIICKLDKQLLFSTDCSIISYENLTTIFKSEERQLQIQKKKSTDSLGDILDFH